MIDRCVAPARNVVGVVLAAALVLIAWPTAVAQAQPAVTTNLREYPAGATVQILGSGFAANETVSVKVHRSYSIYEVGAPFVPFTVETDATGHFSAPWQLADDTGVNFLITAFGPVSGLANIPEFHRVAQVATDRRRYAPGDTAHVSGSGFRPGDAVTVSMESAQPTAPGPATADAQGRISATFVVDNDSSAPSHRVEALGSVDAYSWISAMSGFADGGTTVIDDGGANDVDKTYFHWREDDLLYYRFSFRKDIAPRALDVTIGWNASWMTSDFNNPIIYLDTNHNGRIDLAIAHEVEGDPIDNRRFAFPYTCDDSSAVTCANSHYLPGIAGTSWFKATAGTLVQNLVLPMSQLGLPADSAEPTIVNVCNGNEDCVVTPGNGFLTLEQLVPSGSGTGTFAFNLASGAAQNGATGWSITPAPVGGGSFGTVQFISMAPGTYTLNDVVPAGWQVTSAGCKSEGLSASAEGLPAVGPATVAVSQDVIHPGQVTRCKFSTSRVPTTAPTTVH